MPAKSNIDQLEKINESFKSSEGMYVIDYRGLSVKEAQELRRELRANGAVMKIYKNNLVKIALEQNELPNIDEALVGTCAYVFFENDPVAAAKAIKATATKLKKISFLGGIASGKALTADDAKAYADLPSREELLAQLLYVMASPISGIAQVCKGPATGLATALEAIVDQKNAA